MRRVSTQVENGFNLLSTDLVAFLVVLIRTRALKRQRCKTNVPSILDTVTRDTAVYFSVIFSSHFLLVLTLRLMRVRTRYVIWIQIGGLISHF